nr:uncharacterized protein [Tanacetum cinerariifolium]
KITRFAAMIDVSSFFTVCLSEPYISIYILAETYSSPRYTRFIDIAAEIVIVYDWTRDLWFWVDYAFVLFSFDATATFVAAIHGVRRCCQNQLQSSHGSSFYRSEAIISSFVISDRKRIDAYCSWKTGIKRFCCSMAVTAQLSYRFNADQLAMSHQILDIGIYIDPNYVNKYELDAAVVELHCNEEAEIKYLTVHNWYAGNENEKEECIVPSYDMNQLDAFVVELHCNEELVCWNAVFRDLEANGTCHMDLLEHLMEYPRTTPTTASKQKVLLHEDKLPANSMLSHEADDVTNKDKGAAGRKRRPRGSHTMEHPVRPPTTANKLKVLLHEDKLPANSVLSHEADDVTNKDKGAAERKRRPRGSHTMSGKMY